MEELKVPENLKQKQAFFKELPLPDLPNLVSSAEDASGECPEDFKCNICHRLVFEPKECIDCNQIFC